MLIDKLAIALISPLGSALVAWLLSCLLLVRRRLGWALVFGLAGVVWLGVWSLPVASNALVEALEARYPPRPVAEVPEAEAIVVLGGAIAPTADKAYPLDLSGAADRVWHGVRLYRAAKAPLVVLSGGASERAVMSEAQAMARFMADMGVPDDDMLLESRSRNTRQNARYSATLLEQRGVERIILVTSAMHMGRALGHFRAQGLEVIPAATDYESKRLAFGMPWLPDAGALEASGRAFKEVVGQVVF